MAFWGTFADAISSIAAGAGAQLKSFSGGGGSMLSPEEQQKELALHNTVKDALHGIDTAASLLPGVGIAKKVAAFSGDLLLHAAVGLNRQVLSPYVFRPLSTVALLTDTNSPLYQKGEFEQGFQFNDIKAAYERSAKVSTMQALTKSNLLPFTEPLSAAVLSLGHIDLAKVNLWDDKSIEKNYVDNAVGRWFTGLGDFVVGNAALGAVGKGLGVIAKAGGKSAGLYTATKTVDDLALDMEAGILHASTNGAQGALTVSGTHAVLLAQSKDYGVISDLVEKYSTNGRLVNLIHDASTPNAVKDLILADKGNVAAMDRLATTAPDELFDLSGTAAQLQAKYMLTGQPYVPTGTAIQRLKSAYDAAIAKEPQFVKIRDAFFDENYYSLSGGKAFMPIEPVIGKAAYLKGAEIVRDVKGAARFREFDKMGQYLEVKLGSRIGGAVTHLVKFSSRQTEYKPLGFITFSGVRPLDGRVELNAFLGNIKLFRDGAANIETAPGVYQKTADVLREFEASYMASIGKNEIEALDKIDEKIGKLLSYKAGLYDDAEISNHIRTFRGRINTGLESLKSTGFAIGHDGRRIETSAQTIRQLNESYRFTPWDSIESQFISMNQANRATNLARGASTLAGQVFRDLNRVWTFDVLVRPMYIIKQSIAEPIVSATLAQGVQFITKDVVNISAHATLNLYNTVQYGIRKIYHKSEWKAAAKAVADKQQMYHKASAIKDSLQVEVENLLKGAGVSPTVKASALGLARKDLQAAGEMLDKIELDLRHTVVPLGAVEAMPSLTTLERRIGFLKSKSPTPAVSAEIANAETIIRKYKHMIHSLATNKTAIQTADDALTAAYKNIDNILADLKPALKAQADVWGKSASFKKRYYAPDTQTRMVNGQLVTIDSFVTGENNFSAAMRAEISNARTTDLNLLGELSVGMKQGTLARKVPPGIIRISDPLYFKELEHVANRLTRQDPLMDLILGNTSMAELTRWAQSDAGIRYLRNFDIYEAKQIPAYLADKVALIERTFPSMEARAAILNREVTAQELQSWLAPYVDELYDIVPTNFAYGVMDAYGPKGYGQISAAVNNATAKIFRVMASAENPLRNAFFDNVALDAMARKASYLESQGIKMTAESWNALRQSAGREAIQELEKTVYTVRRENRLLHNARAVVAFPTATVNAFYRYGRLAIKNPVRSTGFAYNYGRTFQTFGVDENGNPTSDINAMTHLIVPGTKEVGLGYMGEGLALGARSVGFLLNMPSPSFITGISVGRIMETFPGTEQGIKDIMNLGGSNMFNIWFPYGAPTSITKAFTPPYANALFNAAIGNEGKTDYLASWNSVYNYHKMLVEMGAEKKFPTEVQIKEEVRALWSNKFLSGFLSVAGVPYKVETNPMRLTTNLYYRLLDKYKAQNLSVTDARAAAGDEMLSIVGTKFMLDRVLPVKSSKNMNIPGTLEAYNRVFKENDALVRELADIEPGQISLVALLTADLSRNSADQSSNILNILNKQSTVLPGTSQKINDLKLTPHEAEVERLKSRTWAKYNLVRTSLEAKITDGKTLRAHPELKSILDQLTETTFKGESQAWYDEYQLAASGDKSYKYARAFKAITTNEQFMAKSGTSQFWHDTKLFMRARDIFVAFYQSLPDYDKRKGAVKDYYNAWVGTTVKQWDPNLQTVIKNYFDNDSLKAVD